MKTDEVLSQKDHLRGLAKELGWRLEDDRVVGQHRSRRISIEIDRRRLGRDLLVISLDAPSVLAVSICKEGFRTHATRIIADVMEKLGARVYVDIETGDPEIDGNLFFDVAANHVDHLRALIGQDGTVPLLKSIFSRFDHINMTGRQIQFCKLLEKGDLDSSSVRESLEWIKELDALDGIYL